MFNLSSKLNKFSSQAALNCWWNHLDFMQGGF